MSNLTAYGANAVLAGTAMPTTLYAQVHEGLPGLGGAMSWAPDLPRIAFTRTTPSGGLCSNAIVLAWTDLPHAVDPTHISFWSALTSGNCWMVAAFSAPGYLAGDTLEVAIGDIDMAIGMWT